MILCPLLVSVLAACGGGGGGGGGGTAAVSAATDSATGSLASAATADGGSAAAASTAASAADLGATSSGTADVVLVADAGETADTWVADASGTMTLAVKATSVQVPIASEGQTFRVPGTMTVRFGAGNAWVSRNVTTSGTCSVGFFGADPAVGTGKTCQVSVAAANATGTSVATVGLPANEGAGFFVLGTKTVYFGANGKSISKSVTGRGDCNAAFFGSDPVPGVVKTCELTATTAALAAMPAPTLVAPVVVGSLMPTVDLAKVAAAVTGFATARVMAANVADPGQNPVPSDIGDFREYCEFSHMSYDDPIAAPGSKSAHLHTFLGNTGTDANSTAASIANTGNSTCAGGTLNRTAYWVPSLIDTTDGTPQKPLGSLIYYKQGYNYIKSAAIKPYPAGLRMIAGNPASSGEQSNTGFTCYKPDGTWTSTKSIPADCPSGSTLTIGVAFPQCWDGVNLDSPDHKSHMAYPGVGCPSTHPVPLTGITFNINYKVGANGTGKWRLSSDNYDRSLPGGYSTHADWFNGWNTDIMNVWTTKCINATMDCHAFLIGDGRILY